LVLLTTLLSFTASTAQTYTANFSTQPTINKYGYENQPNWPWNSTVTVNLGGVDYLITDAINGSFTWNGSAIAYETASTVSLHIKRKDGLAFKFYGVSLKYTNYQIDPYYVYPFLTVQYATTGSAQADELYGADQTLTLSKSAGVAVTGSGVTLNFSGLATLILDDLIVGPAGTTPACTSPTLPTISATRTAICAGSTATLSIQSGSLNDATAWRWYSGSCGGTLVGTGSSITVSPSSTTTYYVRGEGGCVTAGTCASQQITVNALPIAPSTTNVSYCQNATSNPLTASGQNLKWYTAASGGTAFTSITPSTSTAGSTTYYVSQTNANGCESDRAAITVTIKANPNPPTVTTPVTYCQGQTASPLTAMATAGGNLNWFGPSNNSLGSIAPTPPTTAPGTTFYSVSQTVNGCTSPTATITVVVNALPTPPAVSPVSVCQGATPVSLATGVTSGTNLRWYTTPTGGTASTVAPTPATSNTGSTTFFVSQVNSNGCESSRAAITVTVNPLPAVSIVPSALTGCAGTIITLSAQGADRYIWNTGATTTSIPVTATGTGVYSVTGAITSTGCSATASQSITIYPLPAAPSVLTQSGQSYPGGQSSVTVDVNSGNVNLVVGGCNGTINWTGLNNTSGTSSPIVASTDRVGTYVYTATCTSAQGCTSPATSATVIVQGRLTVLHRDVDNYADNNAIQPLLVLQNQGSSALPLSRLTLRYYVTVENGGTLGNLNVNYAQVGGQNVRLRYVALNPTQQGASGYVEVSFTAGAGNLAAGANTGPIQGYFTKSDYGALFEPDDYSYNPVRDQLTGNVRITAYYDGVLIAGIEPGSNAQIRALRALTESRNGPDATQINTVLEVRNEGTVAINYSDLKARYYFTSDGNERLLVEVDEGNITTQLVKLAAPVNGADYYLEIRYNQGGQLAPGASTGAIRYRISKPDGGRFNQANDYSYQEQPQDRAQNSRLVVLAGNQVVWGTPPAGAPARLAYEEAGSELSVKVLGNPIQNDQVSFEVTGAEGQALKLQLLTPQGRVVNQQLVPYAEATQRHQLSVAGQAGGMYLLQVSSPTQRQTVKVIKAQ
jgi:hypothetical protein